MPRITLQTVLDSINQLRGSVGSLEGRFDGLEKKVDSMDDRLDTLAINVHHIDEKLDRCATKDELFLVKSDLLASMDRIASKYDRVDIEITAGVDRDDKLDHRVTTLEQKYA